MFYCDSVMQVVFCQILGLWYLYYICLNISWLKMSKVWVNFSTVADIIFFNYYTYFTLYSKLSLICVEWFMNANKMLCLFCFRDCDNFPECMCNKVTFRCVPQMTDCVSLKLMLKLLVLNILSSGYSDYSLYSVVNFAMS